VVPSERVVEGEVEPPRRTPVSVAGRCPGCGSVTTAPYIDLVSTFDRAIGRELRGRLAGLGDRKIFGLMRADGHDVSVSTVERGNAPSWPAPAC
jgi:hypothetical protein